MTIRSNLVFQSAATYLIGINGARASSTSVGGTATLSGASVSIAAGSAIVGGQKYTILSASGGVSGTFDPSPSSGALSGTLSYDANDVFLCFCTLPLAPSATINQRYVAAAIDGFLAGGSTLPAGFQSLFGLRPAQLAPALDQLSGEVGTGASLAGFQLMNDFMALLLDPFAEGRGGAGMGPVPFAPGQAQAFPPDIAQAYASILKALHAPVYGRFNVWGAAFGGSNTTGGDPAVIGSHDVTARASGFVGGLDYRVAPDMTLGAAVAGGGTS
jgi:hypothetical protein